MSTAGDKWQNKLIERLKGPPEFGPLRSLFTVTFDLSADFFEEDFLPAVFGLGAWDDRRWTTRIALERSLAGLDGCTVIQEAHRFQGRPRSLRVEVLPFVGRGAQRLHSKIVLLVFEEAVRLLVTSANLTESGYRINREVGLCLDSSSKRVQHGALIAQALGAFPEALTEQTSETGRSIMQGARAKLAQWGVAEDPTEEGFLWGGGKASLWRQFLARWPAGETVRNITIVSPFWSEEDPEGPLSQLLNALRTGPGLSPKAELTLIGSAAPDSKRRPMLPDSVRRSALRWQSVRGFALAADPTIRPEEREGGEEVLRERSLHAKVVLLEGPKTILGYLGSANFTSHGWGFLSNPGLANIEAGVCVLRRGSAREGVRALVPPTAGERVELALAPNGALAPPAQSEITRPWPAFVTMLRLRPSSADEQQLELALEVDPTQVQGVFRVALPGERGRVLVQADAVSVSRESRFALSPPEVRELLIHQQVHLWWWVDAEINYPVNVDPSARDSLPLAPEGKGPTEETLLAYYQGRLHWEDNFGPASERAEPKSGGAEALRSEVDSGKIQSYQVRAFVEALPGIEKDLLAAAVSEPSIRLALTGPVSPVALAHEIAKAVKDRRRTAVAAGFQLVELLGCLDRVRHQAVPPKVAQVWEAYAARAVVEVQQQLDRLRQSSAGALGDASFAAYEAMVLGPVPQSGVAT